jgi:subtilisin family serine protease
MTHSKAFVIALSAIFAYLLVSSIAFASNENIDKVDSKLLGIQGETKVIVIFSKKPAEYKNIIKSIGGEIVYDYNNVEGIAIKVKGEDIQKLLKMSNVLRIQEDKKVKALLHDSAPLISANDVWEKGITGKDVKVCIVDTGVNYSHKALDPYCRFVNVVDGVVEPRVLESPHPYPASYNYTWNVTRPGFTKISVHFVNISIEVAPSSEPQGDFLYVKDANGNTLQTFIGNYKDVWSVSVLGDTININLVSDWYYSKYGFYIDGITDGNISQKFDNCTKFIGGYDFVNNDKDPMDDSGHGTHVAGILSSNDAYSRGIANGTKILVAKVLDSIGNGYDSDVMAGIDWCINNSAQIISMSLGGDIYSGTCDSDGLANAVNSAVDKGVTVVVAAGNEGACGITTPACASKAIAVGSVDKNRSVAGYSSKGSRLDILAPGSNINSTFLNRWNSLSGTSMATPHVSGVVALMLEANSSLTPSFIKDAIKSTADSANNCYNSFQLIGSSCTRIEEIQIPCTTDATGAGIINASRAVDTVSVDFSPPKYSDINAPTNPTLYSNNAQYSFSIKWIDDKALDTVLFEFNGQNYTDFNRNRNIFTKVFNDLPAGAYTYKWYANDTSGKWNNTELFNFTIQKVPSAIKLLINNIEGNITVTYPNTVNVTALLTTGEDVLKVYENEILVGEGVSLTELKTYEEGTYNITAIYQETENYTAAFKTYFITVKNDTIPPIITVLSPENIVINKNFVFINITSNEPLSIAKLEWNGVNETIFGSGTNWYKNKTGLSDANYSYRIFGIDLSGNQNKTDFRWVKIDTNPPVITIVYPLNNTSYHKVNVPLNFTIDKQVQWTGYSLDSQSNKTITGKTNLTGLTNGNHSLIVYANDTNGNIGYNRTYFSYCLADINDNKVVDLGDLVILSNSYNKNCGQAGYDSRADLNGDCSINLGDLVILSNNYGKKC